MTEAKTLAEFMAYLLGFGGIVGFATTVFVVMFVEGLVSIFHAAKAIIGGRH